MTRKHVYIIVALVFIAGVVAFLAIQKNTADSRQGQEVQSLHDSSKDRLAISSLRSAGPAHLNKDKLEAYSDLDVKSRERAKKVREGLEKFKSRTDHLSREQIQRDFERVSEKKREFEARPTSDPKVEPFIDDEGNHFKKLTYETGAVRYELDEN